MKIILSAYACHPYSGSEPGVGWHWVRELSKRNSVIVMFYSGQGQEDAVRKESAHLDYQENITLVPISVPRFFQSRLYRLRYEIWQFKAYLVAKRLTRDITIDLVHHVTLATWWNCGHLWKLDIPFIFGPISGAQCTPAAGFPFLRTRDKLTERIRTLFVSVGWLYWPRFRKAIKRASLVLAANKETERETKRFRTEDI
jgi:hypothetical protein